MVYVGSKELGWQTARSYRQRWNQHGLNTLNYLLHEICTFLVMGYFPSNYSNDLVLTFIDVVSKKNVESGPRAWIFSMGCDLVSVWDMFGVQAEITRQLTRTAFMLSHLLLEIIRQESICNCSCGYIMREFASFPAPTADLSCSSVTDFLLRNTWNTWRGSAPGDVIGQKWWCLRLQYCTEKEISELAIVESLDRFHLLLEVCMTKGLQTMFGNESWLVSSLHPKYGLLI